MTPSHRVSRRALRRVSSSSQMSLLDAATWADENTLAAALRAGADVNSTNGEGRSALMCAIGGDR